MSTDASTRDRMISLLRDVRPILCDCWYKCRCGDLLGRFVAAMSRSEVDDEKLIIAILLTCSNVTKQRDSYSGRSLLHYAALFGRVKLAGWLVNTMNLDGDLKDTESGYTPLALSLFFGQIACSQVLLSKSDPKIEDNEMLNVLEFVHEDTQSHVRFDEGPFEVCTSGENATFNLGHSNANVRQIPESVDLFRRLDLSITKVALSKLHGVFLTSSGQVFVCGHGRGGRLGTDSEQTMITPKKIHVGQDTSSMIDVAVGLDHSIFLDADGKVFTCGQNQYGQLGLGQNVEKALTPTEVPSNKWSQCPSSIGRVLAAGYYSLVHTDDLDASIFVFGLNLGQLGLNQASTDTTKSNVVWTPKQVTELGPMVSQKSKQPNNETAASRTFVTFDGRAVSSEPTRLRVDLAEQAVVVLKPKGEVWVMHKAQCIRIAVRMLDTRLNLSKSATQVIGVTASGLWHWSDVDSVLRSCRLNSTVTVAPNIGYLPKRNISVKQVAFHEKSLLLLSTNGMAYEARLGGIKSDPVTSRPASTTKFTTSLPSALAPSIRSTSTGSQNPSAAVTCDYRVVHVGSHVQGVHRACHMQVDGAGTAMAFIQQNASANLTDIPLAPPSTIARDFGSLQRDGYSTTDFKIRFGANSYDCHRFIIFSRAPVVQDLIAANQPQLIIDTDDLSALVVEAFIEYLYTDDCDLLRVGYELGLEPPRSVDGQVSPTSTPKKPRKKKKGKGASSASTDDDAYALRESELTDPLKQMLQLAKTYQVLSLTKRLTAIGWKYAEAGIPHSYDANQYCGRVQRVANRNMPRSKLMFQPDNLAYLHDVSLVCDDGQTLSAHRCVLLARLEYFRTMLAADNWAESLQFSLSSSLNYEVNDNVVNDDDENSDEEETDRKRQIKFPVTGDVAGVILHWAYTDVLPDKSQKSSSISDELPELLCRTLIAADLLLADELREQCEAVIARKLSLRNALDLLQFSHVWLVRQCLNLSVAVTRRVEENGALLGCFSLLVEMDVIDFEIYNAAQLTCACQQFICLNLSAFLDSPAWFCSLQNDCLLGLAEYYKTMYPKVSHRRAPAILDKQYTATQINELFTCMEQADVSRDALEDFILNGDLSVVFPSVSSETKASRMKKTTDVDVKPVITPVSADGDGWHQVVGKSGKRQVSGKESSPEDLQLRSTSVSISEEHDATQEVVPPPLKVEPPIKSKQPKPKFLSLAELEARRVKETETAVPSLFIDVPKTIARSRTQPWGIATSPPTAVSPTSPTFTPQSPPTASFRDLMIEEEARSSKSTSAYAPKKSITPIATVKAARSPSNPWNTPTTASNPIVTLPSQQQQHLPLSSQRKSITSSKATKLDNPESSSFTSILAEQQLSEAQLQKLRRNRPLAAIQTEERAIDQILAAYGAADNWDELITVTRMVPTAAEPVWQARQ